MDKMQNFYVETGGNVIRKIETKTIIESCNV
jgi:hypothetical protein